MIDAYDAAVVERREDGKVKIVKKQRRRPHASASVLGGGVGLATGLVVVRSRSRLSGVGSDAATTAGGAIMGAVAGHAAAGMSRQRSQGTRRAPRLGHGGPRRGRRVGHGRQG